MTHRQYIRLTNLEKIQHMASCKRVTVRTVRFFDCATGKGTVRYVGKVSGVEIYGKRGGYFKAKEDALNAARAARDTQRAKAKQLGLKLA